VTTFPRTPTQRRAVRPQIVAQILAHVADEEGLVI